ncbi:DUF4129 domain-containing protein [Bacillus sp. REN16]|uniref:DUF4129 domain-containing protein n=1 Tax=Bacillus sp. REN16 TaxID=2887296 RepID=UPI001E45CA6F|nr:DUF4129 domain-containing protein [Bacillus sp. REN16]MCC3357667.1 DUF4129 domain-containing protein [Bacillus sp. REN16]
MRFSQSLLKSYPYIMEVILLYILLILLYIHTVQLPPILPFLFITGAGAVLIGVILSLMKSNTPYLFIMLVVPLLAIVSSKMGLAFGQSLVIAAVVCYRIIIHYLKKPKLTEAVVLNGSLLIGGLTYFAAKVQGYVHSDLVLYLLVTQLVFFMIGKILNSVSQNSFVMNNVTAKNNVWSVIGLFCSLFIGAIAVAVVFPILFVKGLSFVSSMIGTGLYWVSKPLFNAVEDIESVRGSQGESVGTLNWEETEKKNPFLEMIGSFDIWFYLMILGALILAVILFILARKRFVKEVAVVGDVYQYVSVTEGIRVPAAKWRKPKRQPPQAKVRRLILDLEVLSAQHGLGRHHHESVTEWLSRNHFLDDRLVELYERVRYGDEEISADENLDCEEMVKQIKAKIKSLTKKK